RAVSADELDTGLQDLARSAAQRGLLTEHRSDVGQPENPGHVAISPRHEPRDAGGEIRPERDEAAVAVEELHLAPLRGVDRSVLEKRRMQRRESGRGEALRHGL